MKNKFIFIICQLLFSANTFCLAQSTLTSEPDSFKTYSWREPAKDGIGKVYMGREIARVISYQEASWLERKGREISELPDEVITNLSLKPTHVVADIGAGTGYYSVRLSKALPYGQVLAVDIQEEMLTTV